MFTISWTQHPVGHGGFHSGKAALNGATVVSWVFDCGSRRTAKFDNYLKTWISSQRTSLDWLFISHFDTDHVSGIDTLMMGIPVTNVMIPYVNDEELALILLHEIRRGKASRMLVELIADPAGFFLSRGATNIYFLGEGYPDESGEGRRDKAPDSPGRKEKWPAKIEPSPKEVHHPLLKDPLKSQQAVYVINAITCDILSTDGTAGLLFKPYRAPISTTQKPGIVSELEKLTGTFVSQNKPGLGELAYSIALHARTANGRRELREVFKAHAGSSNRSSLSLLSIPRYQNKNCIRWHLKAPQYRRCGQTAPGWMNTGDAELLRHTDLDHWCSHYRNYLKQIRVLALPHHGSDKNSNHRLQDECNGAMLTAHVKSNSSKHPGLSVRCYAGPQLNCVTENPSTIVHLDYMDLMKPPLVASRKSPNLKRRKMP
nr:hypothetical protein [uncultured Hyphomonas sp.]